MEKKEIALYTTIGILLIETVVIAWAYWNKDKNTNKDNNTNNTKVPSDEEKKE